jgi:hypothetical protein
MASTHDSRSQSNNAGIILFEIVLWVIATATIFWLWDRWMLDGPHGPYRWMGMDFAPFWVGVREMFAGADPYSQATTLKIQQVVYGGPALGGDPMMFVYPAWMFLLIAPLAALPYPWAAILYIGTLLWALLNVLGLMAWNFSKGNSRVHLFWMIWLVLGSLPFIIISVTKGQLGYLSLIALFATRRLWDRKPFWAGVLLSLVLIKPTVTVIPAAGFLLWALFEKDWKFIGGFLASIGTLFVTSLLASGNWIPGYLSMLSIKGGMPVLWSLDALNSPWNFIFAAFFGLLGVYSFVIARRQRDRNFWLSTTFLLGIALTPMRWIYDLYMGVLIPPEKVSLSKVQSLFLALAVAAPWVLIFVPDTGRWNTAVLLMPIVWALYLLVQFAPYFFAITITGKRKATVPPLP